MDKAAEKRIEQRLAATFRNGPPASAFDAGGIQTWGTFFHDVHPVARPSSPYTTLFLKPASASVTPKTQPEGRKCPRLEAEEEDEEEDDEESDDDSESSSASDASRDAEDARSFRSRVDDNRAYQQKQAERLLQQHAASKAAARKPP